MNVVALQIHEIDLTRPKDLTLCSSNFERPSGVEVTRAEHLEVFDSNFSFESKRQYVAIGVSVRPDDGSGFHPPVQHDKGIASRIGPDERARSSSLAAVAH